MTCVLQERVEDLTAQVTALHDDNIHLEAQLAHALQQWRSITMENCALKAEVAVAQALR